MITHLKDLEHGLDPVAWSIEVLDIIPDEWQKNALRCPSKRVLMNCARQSGKSTIASILALHRCVFVPGSLVLLVSPSLRQSGELLRIVNGYLARLPDVTRVEENKTSIQLSNESRCISLPGTEQTIRGFSGVNLIVVDEAARVDDALITGLTPMLAVSGGRLLALSTPWGRRGWWYRAWSEGGEDYFRYEVPATECSRISKDFLERERRSLGEWAFLQEFCCAFSETRDSVFSYDLIQSCLSDDVLPLFSVNGKITESMNDGIEVKNPDKFHPVMTVRQCYQPFRGL